LRAILAVAWWIRDLKIASNDSNERARASSDGRPESTTVEHRMTVAPSRASISSMKTASGLGQDNAQGRNGWLFFLLRCASFQGFNRFLDTLFVRGFRNGPQFGLKFGVVEDYRSFLQVEH
jgi:hypothetical protein